jgi:hypothetical protein
VRAGRWKRPTVFFDEQQNIVENLQDIVENSEDIITLPHPGSLMYARSWKSQVDRRESVTPYNSLSWCGDVVLRRFAQVGSQQASGGTWYCYCTKKSRQV